MPKHSLKFEIESKVVTEFRAMKNAGQLILQPDYQRKAVWPDRAKVSLMETILLGYPIPEIYLSYETTPDGEQTVAVVDGQQRLTALLEFLDNQYSLEGLEDKELAEELGGRFFRDLPDDVRTEFFQYRFPIRRLSNLDDEFVRSVFARVNRVNMVLTDQEIRNALLPGPYNDFLRDCVAHDINVKSGVFSGERRKRGGDLEFYAEVFGTCIFGVSNKKMELDERYDQLSKAFDDYSDRSFEFLSVLDALADIIKWEGRTRWSNIVDLFTLLHVWWDLRVDLANALQVEPDPVRDILDAFQRAVSSYRRDGGLSGPSAESSTLTRSLAGIAGITEEDATGRVTEYLSGVRNSSDLASRRARSRSLRSVLESHLATRLPKPSS